MNCTSKRFQLLHWRFWSFPRLFECRVGSINQASQVPGWVFFFSCIIIKHFTACWPLSEIALFKSGRSLVWSPWQPQRPMKTMCALEVSSSRTPNIKPLIHPHFFLGKSSRCKCQLDARTWSFKWIAGMSLSFSWPAWQLSTSWLIWSTSLGRLGPKERGGKSWRIKPEEDRTRKKKDEETGWVVRQSIMMWGQWIPGGECSVSHFAQQHVNEADGAEETSGRTLQCQTPAHVSQSRTKTGITFL